MTVITIYPVVTVWCAIFYDPKMFLRDYRHRSIQRRFFIHLFDCIPFSSPDPILTAFELSWELRRLSRMETEFRTEYNVTVALLWKFEWCECLLIFLAFCK